ncbi:MAG TPA: VWA domain-containing protein, partial [Thermodesulfobacteriota bacterium]
LARLARRTPPHLVADRPLAGTDGARIRLPPDLDPQAYRLLVLEQAARAARGTPLRLPPAGPLRDLYLLAEGVAIDRWLAIGVPGLLPDLVAARREALAARPPTERLTPAERAVERLVRAALGADPASPPPPFDPAATPEASLRWAAAVWRDLPSAGGYRGVAVVEPWGVTTRAADPGAASGARPDGSDEARPGRQRAARLRRRPRPRTPAEDEPDDRPGMWVLPWDDPSESVEDPRGLQRPLDRDEGADPEGLADSLAELEEAPVVRTPDRPNEVLLAEEPPSRRTAPGGRPLAAGIVYPEWDHHAGAYRNPGAVVRDVAAPEGDLAWAEGVLARQAPLVERVRRRFERLRARRVCLGRQPDGPEIDVDACVAAFADRAAGRALDERLYAAARPARRDISIVVLVDVSASTDAWVSGTRRVIDVEKEALLVTAEALDALGDRYAILSFSGEGPGRVTLATAKDFDEPYGAAVRRRIAGLEPDRCTRVGAAIRHATALLGRERARHRLLLLLSDGRPNDVDRYEGRYGVEDTRQAVVEAQLQGLRPFCLTIDREAPAYLPRVFGRASYARLLRPERLPDVLVELVRRLLER